MIIGRSFGVGKPVKRLWFCMAQRGKRGLICQMMSPCGPWWLRGFGQSYLLCTWVTSYRHHWGSNHWLQKVMQNTEEMTEIPEMQLGHRLFRWVMLLHATLCQNLHCYPYADTRLSQKWTQRAGSYVFLTWLCHSFLKHFPDFWSNKMFWAHPVLSLHRPCNQLFLQGALVSFEGEWYTK